MRPLIFWSVAEERLRSRVHRGGKLPRFSSFSISLPLGANVFSAPRLLSSSSVVSFSVLVRQAALLRSGYKLHQSLVLTPSRCKRENQNASNSAAFNEIATSQQLLLSRLPLGFAAFDQRPCFLPDTRSWRFMPAPKVRKNPKAILLANSFRRPTK